MDYVKRGILSNYSEVANQICLFPGGRGDFSARSILHRRELRAAIGSFSNTSMNCYQNQPAEQR